MKQLFLLQLLLAVTGILMAETSPAPDYAGGSGTESDPYQIASLAQLRLLSESPADWSEAFILTSDIDAEETATWNDGKGFSPIGNPNTKFTGTLDGNMHVIAHLYINNTDLNQGLLGYINGATIKNIGLTGCTISAGNYSGGIIGAAESSNIEQCYITGSVTSSGNVLGGLAGHLYGSNMSQCYTDCTVSGTLNVGGLVGISETNSVIEDCMVLGSTQSTDYRGGIAGQVYKYAEVHRCYVAGIVPPPASSYDDNVGALFGYLNSAKIADNYYDASVNPDTRAAANSHHLKITPLSTSDFSVQNIFNNWDFSAKWVIAVVPGVDNAARPYFHWMADDIYDITFSTGEHGDFIEGPENQVVYAGFDAQPVKAIGKEGYILKHWEDQNTGVLSFNNPFTLTNVNASTSVTAQFEAGYKVTFSAGSGGSIIGETFQEVPATGSASTSEVTAVPDNGNIAFFGWQDKDGHTYSTSNPLIIKTVNQDYELHAVFRNTRYITLNPAKDAMITYKDYYPERSRINYGASAFITILDSEYSARDFQQVLISFSGIQEALDDYGITNMEEEIESVILHLHPDPQQTSNHTGTNDFRLYWFTEDWYEENVTWNNAPAIPADADFIDIAESTSENQDYEIDITDLFNAQYVPDEGNAGFRLVLLNGEAFSRQQCRWVSKEYPDANYHPSLSFELTQTPTGVYSPATGSTIKVAPNPSGGEINISLPDQNDSANMEIYDLAGHLVYSSPDFRGGLVNLNFLMNGTYLVTIKHNNQLSTTKLLIQK